ncbi:MAG: hypothetical protein Q7R52_03895 [archaeon]|nr:hypothetical protein [archaeon]
MKFKKRTENKSCGYGYKCGCGSGSAVYGMGFIGAAIYYISTATTFWIGVLGVLKAIVWPAFLVYELLKFLGM